MERLMSLLGLFVFLFIAYGFSANRRKIPIKTVGLGLALQFGFGILFLWTKVGGSVFENLNTAAAKLIGFSNEGAKMVFGENFRDHFFAFSVLPSIIFLSSLMTVLFHWGIMQRIVGIFTFAMKNTLRTSGAESMATSANIFVGGLEACFTIRPFLEKLTRSELLAVSTAGLSTIAAGVLTVYAGMGMSAGHLMCAQILSSIGALMVSKIILPETETPQTLHAYKEPNEKPDLNTLEAACRGAVEGVKVAAAVCGTLIAFVAFTALINAGLGQFPEFSGAPLTLERIFGWIFTPVVFFTGVKWEECGQLGSLLGKKIFLNEFLAFLDLKDQKMHLSERSVAIATYFLCGFGNFSALAMQVSGLGNLIPKRRHEIASLAGRILLGATLTSLVSACIAGILL